MTNRLRTVQWAAEQMGCCDKTARLNRRYVCPAGDSWLCVDVYDGRVVMQRERDGAALDWPAPYSFAAFSEASA